MYLTGINTREFNNNNMIALISKLKVMKLQNGKFNSKLNFYNLS